jgi:hypothetical protein
MCFSVSLLPSPREHPVSLAHKTFNKEIIAAIPFPLDVSSLRK